MHSAVRDWVRQWCADQSYGAVLEVGSLNINGGVRDLIDTARYVGIDLAAGPGVDRVQDARDHEGAYDLVLCLEALEHDPAPRTLIDALGRLVRPGGLVVATAGGPGREPHSAIDGAGLRTGEHYGNLDRTYLAVPWGETLAYEIQDTDWRAAWRAFGP